MADDEQAPARASSTSKTRASRAKAGAGGKAGACPALTKAKNPCGATPGASGYCFFHDPGVSREEKQAAAVRGGFLAMKRRVMMPKDDAGYVVPFEPRHSRRWSSAASSSR